MTLSKSRRLELARSLDVLACEVLGKIRVLQPQAPDERALERAGVVLDLGDESAARTHDALRHTLLEHLLCELRKIEAARMRLEQDELDRCIDCDGSICYARLHANPVATRCIECQTRYETAHRDRDMLKL